MWASLTNCTHGAGGVPVPRAAAGPAPQLLAAVLSRLPGARRCPAGQRSSRQVIEGSFAKMICFHAPPRKARYNLQLTWVQVSGS